MRRLSALALSLAILIGGEASACPNCREALANQTGEAARLKDGYYYSILVMIAMPFALLGTGVVGVVRAVKRGSLPPL